MHQPPKPRTQRLTIVAQDPGVRIGKGRQAKIVRAAVDLPAENFEPGPCGYRVHVVDYDASSDSLWSPREYAMPDDVVVDPFASATDDELLRNPQFHQQNVYVIVMR